MLFWQAILLNNGILLPFMTFNENSNQPYLKSLAICLNKVVKDGYTEDFKVTEEGLQALQHNKTYRPEEIKVVNFFRFEGTSNPENEAVIYVIETADGTKGTLTDGYDVYLKSSVSGFMKTVEKIQKKTIKN